MLSQCGTLPEIQSLSPLLPTACPARIELLPVLWTRGCLRQGAARHRASPCQEQILHRGHLLYLAPLSVAHSQSPQATLMADVEAAKLIYKYLPPWMPTAHDSLEKEWQKTECLSYWEQWVPGRSGKRDKLLLSPHRPPQRSRHGVYLET